MNDRPGLWLAGLATLLALACSGQSPPAPDSQPLFVYVSPDPLGINPFLIMGQEGVERAAATHGTRALILESEDPVTREENVLAAIDAGASLVIVLGFEFQDIIASVAADNPAVDFLIIDQCIEDPPANVRCALFREFEASFLIGVMAARLSTTGHVAVIGTVDIPFLHRYTDGFAAGARYERPDIRVSTRWVGGDNPFADPARAKEQALDLAADGADHIFAASAAGNLGIFEAARERDFFAFGLDVDQCPASPGHIVDNLVKRVDLVIGQSVDAIFSGSEQQIFVYGLDSGGLDLTALADTPAADSECLIVEHPRLIDHIRQLSALVSSGEIGIEDPMGIL